MKLQVFLFIIALSFASCEGQYTPKPRGYYRIDFPKKEYIEYNGDCPFTFDYPTYGKVVKDDNPRAEPCWLNVEYPKFKGSLHLSYKEINNNFALLSEDSRKFAYKHAVKADAINEIPIETNNKVHGMYYDIKGNTASSIQFILTDSTKHFIRGALYFYSEPQVDSLGPVIKFIGQDIDRMIDSFKWKK